MAQRFSPWSRVREMLGKETGPGNGYGIIRSVWNGFFKHKTTIDYTRNNYALFRSLYYASGLDGITDESILLGAGFAKPIINSTTAFSLGASFKVSIAGADAEGATELKNAESDLQNWVDTNFDQIYDWIKYGNRDGDGYFYIDELGNISLLKPDTVDVVVDAVSGDKLGYNVTENVELLDPLTGQKTKWTYLKQYRRNLIRISRWQENQDQKDAQILYERVFANGTEIDTQLKDEAGNPLNADLQLLPEELDSRPLPIVQYRNEPEPGALYGNSELQNVLIFMRNYGEVLDEATKANVYNSKPVLVMIGVSNPEDDPENKDAMKDNPETGTKELDWQQNTTLYIEDPQGDAKFLEIPNTMENTGKLLEYLFYCIVQASETPEFVLGTAVSSSKASVSEQMPIVAMKAERKRKQLRGPLLDLLNLYIYRQKQLSNPTYYVLNDLEQQLDVQFPPVVDEDKKLNSEIVSLLLTEGVITGQKGLEILLDMSSEDAKAEVQAALKDAKDRAEAAGAVTDQSTRLNNELNGGGAPALPAGQ